MKLENVNDVLEEGLKFTNKERRLVLSEARNIQVGIEYEYHVDSCDGDDDEINDEFEEAVYDRALELMEQEAEGKMEEFVEAFAQNDMDDFNVGSVTASLDATRNMLLSQPFSDSLEYLENNLSDFSEFFDDFDEETGFSSTAIEDAFKETLKHMVIVSNTMSEVEGESSSIEVMDQLDRIINYIRGGNVQIENEWEDFNTSVSDVASSYDSSWDDEMTIDNISDALNTIDSDSYESDVANISTMRGLLEDLQGNDSDWDEQIREGFRDSAEDLWESEKEQWLGFDLDSRDIHQEMPNSRNTFYDQAYEEIEGEGDLSQYNNNCEETITNILQDSPYWDEIETVTTDPSVTDGVEVITEVQELNDAIELMKFMHEHIKEYGSTSTSTGMHVNMSIKGMRFERSSFNAIKLLMLTDRRTLSELFPTRGYTGKVIDYVGYGDLYDLAVLPTNKLIKEFSNMANLNRKHQNINFNNIDASDVNARRIEFRYFGGKDYENRTEEFEEEIYRVAYALMCSFSDGFAEKEYLKGIVRFLDDNLKYLFKNVLRRNVDMDKMSDVVFNQKMVSSFVDFREFVKKNFNDKEEFIEFMTMINDNI